MFFIFFSKLNYLQCLILDLESVFGNFVVWQHSPSAAIVFLHIRTFWHCFNNVAGKISALSSCIILDVPRLTMSAQRQGAGKHVNCSTRCGKRLIYKLLHKYFLQNLQKKKTQIKWYFVTFACACAKEQLIKICLKSAPDVNNYKKSGNRANGRRSLKSVLKKIRNPFIWIIACGFYLNTVIACGFLFF